VGGAAGAVSKITGAMGKGLSALTFDKDYQKKRQNALNKKPSSMQEGLARGGKGLVMGVFDGVTGVVTKPISGARRYDLNNSQEFKKVIKLFSVRAFKDSLRD
jgi:vacuolar protein sorting-associated protein 13A/C